MKVANYISSNIKIVQTFVKIGKLPLSVLNDYDIYLFYKSIDYEPAQMKKYRIVSERFKVHIDTVRRAVTEMEKNINP